MKQKAKGKEERMREWVSSSVPCLIVCIIFPTRGTVIEILRVEI